MRVTRARVGFAMVLGWLCFGCKGIGAIGHVAAATAVAARVVAAGVVAHNIASASSGSSQPAESNEVTYVSAPAPAPACVELPPAPELPGDRVWLRTLDCRGHLIVQDADTGVWRSHR